MKSAADLRSDFERDGILRTFTIAFAPRCGSTLLSHILWAAGAGKPTEYFQYPYDENEYFKRNPGESKFEIFQSLVRKECALRTFASKMAHDHRAHLDFFLKQHLVNCEGVHSIFPNHRWIFARRRDLVAQAISWSVAEKTGVWHLKPNQLGGESSVVEYDFFSVFHKLQRVLADNFSWELYFEQNRFTPLTIVYEDFLADKESTLKSVAQHIGFEPNLLLHALRNAGRELVKISDHRKDVYEAIRARFIDDFMKMGQEDDRERLGAGFDTWRAFFWQQPNRT